MNNVNTFSSYWQSGSNTPNAYDARPYGVLSYSQDKANNKTTYTLAMYLQVAKVDGGLSQVGYNFNSNIGGVTKNFSGTANVSGVGSWGTVYLGSQTRVIEHNADGSGVQVAYNIYGSVNLCVNSSWSSWFANKYSATYYHTAPTLPRISSISNDTTSTNRKKFGEEITFTIDRKSEDFTHDIKVNLNSDASIVIGENVETSCTFTFPESTIENWVNTDVPNVTVTCTTKNGNTIIGTSTTIVYLQVPESYIPTCSLEISEVGNVPSSWGVYVKSKSKIKGVINASGVAGSTITSYNSNVNNQSFTTQEFTTSEIAVSGELVVTSSVIDSRGRKATDSKTINVYDYWTPTISSYLIQRCNADGSLNEEGTYGKIKVTYSIAPIENKNTKTLIVKYGDVTKTFELTEYSGVFEPNELFEDLATNSSHIFEIYICDYFHNEDIKFTFTMTPSYCTISKLAGGKGISIGRVATEEGLAIHMPILKTDSLLDFLYPIGSIYLSVNEADPSELFGGTWEQIKDTFLLASGDTYEAGATGGEAEVTLTIDEMPKHGHSHGFDQVAYNKQAGTNGLATLNNSGGYVTGGIIHPNGGDKPHNNMPPYLAVYMWKRIN